MTMGLQLVLTKAVKDWSPEDFARLHDDITPREFGEIVAKLSYPELRRLGLTDCQIRGNKRYWKDPKKYIAKRRIRESIASFGMRPDAYEKMIAYQRNLCILCGNPETVVNSRTKQVRELSREHNHKTLRVRGLACHGCNRLLRSYEYNTRWMAEAKVITEMLGEDSKFLVVIFYKYIRDDGHKYPFPIMLGDPDITEDKNETDGISGQNCC
jgi:hypothetical protein